MNVSLSLSKAGLVRNPELATMRLTLFVIFLSLVVYACKEKTPAPLPPPVVKQDDTTKVSGAKPLRAPIINITDTVETSGTIIYIKDSAATSAGLSKKLTDIYNKKLPKLFKDKKLKPVGPPMAWFKKQEAPFFFEAGIMAEGNATKPGKGFFSRKITKDSAFVAHFFGPAELTPQAYTALSELANDRKKKRRAPAYEVYVSNPFDSSNRSLDAYKMQTDIVLPYR